MATAAKKIWHAVSVIPGAAAWSAAQQLRGQRFLPRAAPHLPRADCAHQDHCQCKYQHHADRRDSPRRNTDTGATNPTRSPAKERRRPGERRERRR